MEELNREQPTMEPANVINITEENGAVSEVGSQNTFGKFKNAEALLEAYNNLQSEFTKKCQLLSQMQKDKMDENQIDSEETINQECEEEKQKKLEQDFQSFLDANSEAKLYEDEIKQRFNNSSITNQSNPYEVAWARVVLEHLKDGKQKESDPIINNYVLSDEKVRNQIILDYLNGLIKHKPPYVISSQGGERVSSVELDTPTSLAEAKEMVSKMFN